MCERPVLPPYNPEEVRGLARDLTATRRDLSDALRENAELEQFVRLCATGKRPDGTYNLGREALEQQARELLESHRAE